jgi:hypothetical protein
MNPNAFVTVVCPSPHRMGRGWPLGWVRGIRAYLGCMTAITIPEQCQ